MKRQAAITAVGGYVPNKVLTNQMLEQMVETSDEWIRERTGIEERRILDAGKGSSDMGVEAAKIALAKRGIGPEEIDIIICATVTPDHVFPATANLISDKLGATNAWSFDVGAACSGFLYSLATGAQYIETGRAKKVLVVGADKMSSIVDYEDRNTCIIFGDGAGAVLLEPSEEEGVGIQDFVHYTDGAGVKYLHMKAGGSVSPATVETVMAREHYVYQEGKQVFKHAVVGMADAAAEIMQRNQLSSDDVSWLVPHQANLRIIDATRNRMGLELDKVMVNIHRYGNTTSGTIPLCLSDWEQELKKGDKLVLAAFGGGFTWGANYVVWAYDGK